MKKYLIFIILITSFCFLSSCSKNEFTYSDLNSVTYEKLLSLPKGTYIVIAYQTTCSNCEKLKDTVEAYYKYASNNSAAYPIYGINVNLAINKNIQLTSKDDSYPSDMIGTSDYTHVKVKSTPSIMLIQNGKLVKVISDYNTDYPVTEGKKYLNGLMN